MNSIAETYTSGRLASGCSISFAEGGAHTRESRRDPYRRELTASVTNALRNSVIAAFNGVTNAYTANGLNQYASIVCASASPCETAVGYDPDGNTTQCGDWTYTYDAANRLKTVSSNGVLLVTNDYDAKGRRVRKVTPESTMTFFYDGWNLIEERVANANGTASTIHYYWGKDISGTLQDAGGVGGLLYLTVDGSIHVPCYDHNGNVTRYLDANGCTVAQYVYDAFGRTISQTGSLADIFRHRFSTKYLDSGTSLYYYGYRFYSPVLRRWLTRDPIEEDSGLNLYGFCGNNPVSAYDCFGKYWEFSTPKWNKELEELDFTVKYIMSASERRCCHAVTVDRYVRKLFGVGNRFGPYSLDHAADGGMTDFKRPYVGYAESDSPDGQNFYFYRLPWTQSFKWEARCTAGPGKGKILSSVERQFKTSGHFLWNPKREGWFK